MIKSTLNESERRTTEEYPCLMKGVNTKKIILAMSRSCAVVLHPGTTTLRVGDNPSELTYSIADGAFVPYCGEITLETAGD